MSYENRVSMKPSFNGSVSIWFSSAARSRSLSRSLSLSISFNFSLSLSLFAVRAIIRVAFSRSSSLHKREIDLLNFRPNRQRYLWRLSNVNHYWKPNKFNCLFNLNFAWAKSGFGTSSMCVMMLCAVRCCTMSMHNEFMRQTELGSFHFHAKRTFYVRVVLRWRREVLAVLASFRFRIYMFHH